MAFKHYATQSAALREMRAALPANVDSVQIHEINQQWCMLSRAEDAYRVARLLYAERLLCAKAPF
jgi:hypothetical protein